MGFSRQEYSSGLLCPLPGDIPDQGIKLMSLTPPALVGGFFIAESPWKFLSEVHFNSVQSLSRV